MESIERMYVSNHLDDTHRHSQENTHLINTLVKRFQDMSKGTPDVLDADTIDELIGCIEHVDDNIRSIRASLAHLKSQLKGSD